MPWWRGRWSAWSPQHLDQVQNEVLERVEKRSGYVITFERRQTQLSEAHAPPAELAESNPPTARSRSPSRLPRPRPAKAAKVVKAATTSRKTAHAKNLTAATATATARATVRATTRTGDEMTDLTKRSMHSIECRSVRCDEAKPPIVLLHGYGSGALLFVGNLVRLAVGSGRRVIAVDWLGCGASGRPEFTPTDSDQTISWFLDAFEEWLDVNGIEELDMVAHSLGAYLGAQYVLRGGHAKVHNLVLASPPGLPEPPARGESPPLVLRALRYLWESGFNPHMIVRTAGPLGRNFVETMFHTRFASPTLGVHGLDDSDEADRRLFTDYIHQIAAAPESGEHALKHILLPGAWARLPLEKHIHKLSSNVLFLFGERDWLKRDLPAARRAADNLEPGLRSDVKVVAGSHHTYLEDEFDARVLEFITGKPVEMQEVASEPSTVPPASSTSSFYGRWFAPVFHN